MANTFKPLSLGMALLCLFQSGVMDAQQLQIKGHDGSLRSAILKKNVHLIIHLPDSYMKSSMSYPVLYLLHGTDKNTDEIASMANHLHQYKLNPEVIVVGIENTEESIDKLPANTLDDPEKAAVSFLSFMEQELIPSIEKKYRTNGQRILQGKSIFGSFPLYAFVTKPGLFQAYVVASNNWFEQRHDDFMRLANKAFEKPDDFKDKKIFLATLIGAYNNGMEMHTQMLEFSALVRSKLGKNVACKYQIFDDWGLVLHPGFYDGLLYVFEPDEWAATGDEKAVKETVARLLTLAGNHDYEALKPMFLPQANIGISSEKDGQWTTRTMSLEEWITENRHNGSPEKFTKTVSSYTVHISDAQLAFVLADALEYEEGKAYRHSMDYFILMKEHGVWKFLSGAYSSTPISLKH